MTDYRIVPAYKGENRPSIEPAKFRCLQAADRLNKLAEAAGELRAGAGRYPVTVHFARADVAAGRPVPILRWNGRAFDADLIARAKMTAGEVLYHLRTALEYAAYQLVWLDAGVPADDTQFPIVSEADRWTTKMLERRLPGVTPDHVELVRSFQPFAGCEWSEGFRDLSNADKHRVVLRLGIQFGAVIPDKITLLDDPSDEVEFQVETTPLEPTLQDESGEPVLPRLRSYLAGVVDVLNSLSPAFSERGDLRLG